MLNVGGLSILLNFIITFVVIFFWVTGPFSDEQDANGFGAGGLMVLKRAVSLLCL